MKGFICRIKERNGASIVLALFAFMLAAMVSMVIVSAALANVGRVRSLHDEEQQYLTADSVMGLVVDGVQDASINYRTLSISSNEPEYYIDKTGRYTSLTNGTLPANRYYFLIDPASGTFNETIQKCLLEMANELTDGDNVTQLKKTLNLSVQTDGDPITADLVIVMEKDNGVRMTIRSPGGSEATSYYSMTLTMPATYKTDTTVEERTIEGKKEICKISSVSVNWPTNQMTTQSYRGSGV